MFLNDSGIMPIALSTYFNLPYTKFHFSIKSLIYFFLNTVVFTYDDTLSSDSVLMFSQTILHALNLIVLLT